jgi:hypothetical protein
MEMSKNHEKSNSPASETVDIGRVWSPRHEYKTSGLTEMRSMNSYKSKYTNNSKLTKSSLFRTIRHNK